jgi:magnesium-transporting ATPase (P-type)
MSQFINIEHNFIQPKSTQPKSTRPKIYRANTVSTCTFDQGSKENYDNIFDQESKINHDNTFDSKKKIFKIIQKKIDEINEKKLLNKNENKNENENNSDLKNKINELKLIITNSIPIEKNMPLTDDQFTNLLELIKLLKSYHDSVSVKEIQENINKEIFEYLKYIPCDYGLTDNQVEISKKYFGKNVIPLPEPETIFEQYMNQIKDPGNRALLICSLLSISLSEIYKGLSTIALVHFIIGTNLYQSYNEYLNKQLLLKNNIQQCMVKRNNEIVTINSDEIVVGDVCLITEKLGPKADGYILDKTVTVSEALITGESHPIIKNSSDFIFGGSSVTESESYYVVSSIGFDTFIGKIQKLIVDTDSTVGDLQKNISHALEIFNNYSFNLSTCLVIIGILSCKNIKGEQLTTLTKIFNYNYLYEIFIVNKFSTLYDIFTNIVEWLGIGIGMYVALVPEALMMFLEKSKTLSKRFLLENDIKLESDNIISNVAYFNVIVSDKTGTITTGKQEVTEIFISNLIENNNEDINYAYSICKFCNNARIDSLGDIKGNSTDVAIYNFIEKKLNLSYENIYQSPFTSSIKMMYSLFVLNGGIMVYVKGAPDYLFKTPNFKYKYNNQNEVETYIKEKKYQIQ